MVKRQCSTFLAVILSLMICSGCLGTSPELQQPTLTGEAEAAQTTQLRPTQTSFPTQKPTPRPTLPPLPTPLQQAESNCPGEGWTLFTGEDGLADIRISALAVDPHGGVWAAHDRAGLSWMVKGTWYTLPVPADHYWNVNVLLPLENGELWIGSQGGTIRHFGQAGWEMFRLSPYAGSLAVYAAETSSGGEIYAGTSGGLFSRDGEDPSGFSLFSPGEFSVKSVRFDSKGGLWVGGKYGIYYFKDGVWGMYERPEEPYYNVVDIEEHPDGVMWFATLDGVYTYDGRVWERNSPLYLASGEDSLQAAIRQLVVDLDGRVWAVINGTEVQVFENGAWNSLALGAVEEPLGIGDVEMDPWGALWLATDQGVLCFLP